MRAGALNRAHIFLSPKHKSLCGRTTWGGGNDALRDFPFRRDIVAFDLPTQHTFVKEWCAECVGEWIQKQSDATRALSVDVQAFRLRERDVAARESQAHLLIQDLNDGLSNFRTVLAKKVAAGVRVADERARAAEARASRMTVEAASLRNRLSGMTAAYLSWSQSRAEDPRDLSGCEDLNSVGQVYRG